MFHAYRVQFPVGFGGFHVALLGADAPGWPFVLAFDCGSLAQGLACDWARRVGAEINKLFGRIDLLVLSHTDFDHVCGLQALVEKTPIDTLMLPLLTWQFQAAQLSAHAGVDRPHWYRRFVVDPIGWAGSVRVRQVLFVDEGPAPEAVGRQDGPRLPDDDPPRPRLALGPGARPFTAPNTFTLPSGDPLTITTPTGIGWRIVPVVAPPRCREELVRALDKCTRGLNATDLTTGIALKSRGSLRNKLAAIYRRHWGSTNRSSVMLLVAPAYQQGRGWLCTGDADLTSPETRAALQAQGGPWFRDVDAVHVPHHGSPHNLDRSAASFVSALAGGRRLTWVVSSGKNRWEYPHQAVLDACNALGCVRELRSSSSCQDVRCF